MMEQGDTVAATTINATEEEQIGSGPTTATNEEMKDNDSSDDDDDMMNMDMPIFTPPPPPKPEKPSTTFEWNKNAMVDCLQLSLDAHSSDSNNTAGVAEWKAPATKQSSWVPQPVPIPDWAKPAVTTSSTS